MRDIVEVVGVEPTCNITTYKYLYNNILSFLRQAETGTELISLLHHLV